MKTKIFNDYEKACVFCDEVDGQIQWCFYNGDQYWIVWFLPTIIEVESGDKK